MEPLVGLKNLQRISMSKKIWSVVVAALIFLLLFSVYFNFIFKNIAATFHISVLNHQEAYLKAHLQQEALFYLNKGNYTLLEEFLHEQVDSNPLLGYVIISDGSRRILASNVKENFPDIDAYLDNSALWDPGTRLIDADGNLILHSTSIIPGMRRLKFGVWSFNSEAYVQNEIRPIFHKAIFLTSISVFFLMFFAVFVSIGSNNGYKKSDFREMVPSKQDEPVELDELGSVFNDMMATLDSNWQENIRLQQQLKDREFMRTQYLKRIIAVQEGERKRVSRELHDQTSQSLTSLMLGLRAIQEAETLADVKQYTSEYRQLIASSLEEIQNLAFELRPSALDDLGLVPALKRYVNELSQRKNISIDFKWQEYPRKLGEAEDTVVYRVVQEALTNIIKHAEAKNVKIRLKVRQGKFIVLVRDDGIGFDTAAIKEKDPSNLGIYGMKERAHLAGGNLYIKSRANKGTCIFLILPLNYEGGK